ncbi:MAG: GSCFA domain-containing protein, partial [Pseudomonadota bacterium]|nr:GSCFA domain-containing protein [Pseudomonadota bacterium]
GRFIDPFRPVIEPLGFSTPEEVETLRKKHLSAVRKMFEEMDVFIFTLGLTETWNSNIDGAVFPIAPQLLTNKLNTPNYSCKNFSAEEVRNEILGFMSALNQVNSRAHLILTVSPVPLSFTYENRSVITSTCYSKSVLRVAAGEASNVNDNITYFPSYEVICGNYSQKSYFEPNTRKISDEGINHVMRLFFKHFLNEKQPNSNEVYAKDPLYNIICDEDKVELHSAP